MLRKTPANPISKPNSKKAAVSFKRITNISRPLTRNLLKKKLTEEKNFFRTLKIPSQKSPIKWKPKKSKLMNLLLKMKRNSLIPPLNSIV